MSQYTFLNLIFLLVITELVEQREVLRERHLMMKKIAMKEMRKTTLSMSVMGWLL